MSSRSEVEVLLKMRAEGKQALDLFSGGLDTVGKSGKTAAGGLEDVEKKTRSASAASTAAGVAVGLLAERVARGLVGSFKTALGEADKLDAAMIGLGATARAFGTDAGNAQKAAEQLAGDGLMSVGEAASGLKNLLAAGFGLDQAIVLMNRFKDSAAFGRQGSLEFGQAIVGATEGIKNGNSALVDNAGLTKNLSNILVEAGFSAQDLSKVQGDLNVRNALFGGILKETNPQLGQTELYLKTAAGAQAQFNTEITKAEQKIGKELQPVLLGFLQALTPIVQTVGQFSGVLVPLGLAIGTIVGPFAAMRAAAALGIPPISTLTSGLGSLSMAFQSGVAWTGSWRVGMNDAATVAGITTTKLGLLGTAAAIAGAAFVGWQIGKAIDSLTGASNYVQSATEKIMGWGDATQVAGAKQDVITRAIANGARETIGYSQALVYNTAMEAIRAGGFDKSAAAQMKAADAQLLLGKITRQEYEDRKGAIEATERHNQVTANRTSLVEALSGAEAKVRAELAATGLTIPQLTTSLKDNSDAFKAWAEAHGLSAATIKFLEDKVKAQTEAQKKSKEETEKATAEIKRQRDALEQLGIVSGVSVAAQLKEFATLEQRATKDGVDWRVAVAALLPQLQELHNNALRSGIGIDEVSAALKRAKAASEELSSEWIKQFNLPAVTAGLEQMPGTLVQITTAGEIQARALSDAYQSFGIKTRAQLEETAKAAVYNFNLIRSSGTATPAAIKAAHDDMVAAVKASTSTLPTFWETEVGPRVRGAVTEIGRSVSDNFAAMLTGAKGFGDGFSSIWKSIKDAALNTFNEIASAFINGMLKKMLAALAGSAMGGGGGGFGGGWSGLAKGALGLMSGGGGGGAAAGGIPGLGTSVSLTGMTGGGSAAGAGASGAGFAASGVGTALGGLGVAGAGYGLGMLGKKLFGGAGAKAGAFGAASGAGAGAVIGTMIFPGIGTGLGALIGGGAGLLSGLIGKGEHGKVNDKRDEFLGAFGGSGTGAESGFGKLGAELHALGPEGDALFQRVTSAKKMKDFESAVTDTIAALEKQRAKTAEIAKLAEDRDQAAKALAVERQTQIDALNTQLTELDARRTELVDSIAAEAPEEVMGVVEAETRARIAQIDAEKAAVDQQIQNVIDANSAALQELEAQAAEADARIREQLERPITRHVYYEDGGVAGPRGGSLEGAEDNGTGQPGGAAAGIYANRPTLAVFGEGGEPEIGGPKSFFADVFRALGVGTGGNGDKGGAGAAPLALTMNITTLDADGLRAGVEREVIPMILDAIRSNRRGSRTDFRAALSVD